MLKGLAKKNVGDAIDRVREKFEEINEDLTEQELENRFAELNGAIQDLQTNVNRYKTSMLPKKDGEK